jgi:hypothetical protein
MKKQLLALLFILSSSFLIECNAQSWMWARQAVPQQHPSKGLGDAAVAAVDGSGNVYLPGDYKDSLSFGAVSIWASDSNLGAFIAKYDSNGNFLWVRSSVDSLYTSTTEGFSAAADGSGNAFFTGFFQGYSRFGVYMLSSVPEEPFLVKYSSTGNVIWAKQSTGTGEGYANSVVADAKGNAYITGSCNGDIVFGSDTVKNGGVFLVKYNNAGNVKWVKQSTLPSDNCDVESYSVVLDQSGNVYISGFFIDTTIFGPYTLKVPGHFGSECGFLAKYDSNGNLLWAKQPVPFRKFGTSVLTSVTIDGMGNLYTTGYFEDSVSFGGITLVYLDFAYWDVFLAKYDPSGNVIWAKQGKVLDGNDWEGYSVASDTLKRGGGYMIMGSSFTSPFKLKFGADTFNLVTGHTSASVLVRFDSAGNIICSSNVFSEGDEDDGDGVGVDHSGKHIYYGGDLYNGAAFGSDTLKAGGDAPFVARWQPCEPVIEEGANNIQSTNINAVLFPNPNKGYFQLGISNYELGMNSKVEIYNMLGEMIYNETLRQAQGDNIIDLPCKSAGVYLYRVLTETGEQISEGKFIIER